MKTQKLLFFMMIIAFYSEITIANSFIDTWYNQKVIDGPSTYYGKKRAYQSFGTVKMRLNLQSDPIITAQGPRMSVGCGGLDIFMGSWSMVNTEYLQTKAERILAAAPMAAFDIGLKVLCQSCANTIKDINAALDRLNNLQLDECKASKALVAYTAKEAGADDPNLNHNISEFKQSTGQSELMYEFNTDKRSDDNKVDKAETDELFSGCPVVIRDIFNVDGSVLEKIGAKLGFGDDQLDMIRGMFGDIETTHLNGNEGIKFKPIDKCSENETITIEKFLNAQLQSKPYENGQEETCIKIQKGAQSFFEWTVTMLTTISQKIIGRSAMTTQEINFINNSGLPIEELLRSASINGMGAVVIPNTAEIVAKGISLRIFSDMLSITAQLLSYGNQIKDGAASGSPDCKLETLNPATQKLKEMQNEIRKVEKIIRDDYYDSLKKHETTVTFLDYYDKQNTVLTKKIRANFKK